MKIGFHTDAFNSAYFSFEDSFAELKIRVHLLIEKGTGAYTTGVFLRSGSGGRIPMQAALTLLGQDDEGLKIFMTVMQEKP